MNAKETIIQYANELKTRSNTSVKDLAPEMIMGQAMVEGICFYRSSNYLLACRMSRTGNVITVTETKKFEKSSVVDGKIVFEKVEETTVALAVEL